MPNAFIYLCNNLTQKECYSRNLFGTNDPRCYEQFRRIHCGDYLFLYNYDKYELWGPYQASSECLININPEAWRNTPHFHHGYPFQIRFSTNIEFTFPLNPDEFSFIKFGINEMPPSIISTVNIRMLLDRYKDKLDRINRIKDFQARIETQNKFAASDGHQFRYADELLIDAYLCRNKIKHEVDYRLFHYEEIYCSFYLLNEDIFIIYWPQTHKSGLSRIVVDANQVFKSARKNLINVRFNEIPTINFFLDDQIKRLIKR